MKVAITGHTHGIGAALYGAYELEGCTVTGLSRSNGYNIRSVPKVADAIEPCDVFVNNAQAGFAQTELLFEMARRWTRTNKHIIVISTQMTQYPVTVIPGLDEYRTQKVTLESAVAQLRYTTTGVRFTLVRPGDIATEAHKTVPPSANPTTWALTLLGLFRMAEANGLTIPDISLGPE
jgi:NADP-dependent 3-hydroxy acid dehydrogenase YdfG